MKKSILTILSIAMSLSMTMVSLAEQPTQSARWVGEGDTWRVSDNQGGFLTNSWFQDDITGHWYLLGAEDGSVMFSGLITDQSTGKTYLLNTNHDGTYGRMLTENGSYTLNGQTVSLTFNQEHKGEYGAITSDIGAIRGIGITEKSLSSIPSDTGNIETPPSNTATNTTSNLIDDNSGSAWVIPDEVWEQVGEANKGVGIADYAHLWH